jgi:hypothetical protein
VLILAETSVFNCKWKDPPGAKAAGGSISESLPRQHLFKFG